MISASLLFLFGLFGVLGVTNALRPATPDWHPMLRSKWFSQLAVAELAPHRFAFLGLISVALVALGALDYRIGRIGGVLVIISLAGYALVQASAFSVKRAMARALEDANIEAPPTGGPSWRDVAIAYPVQVPRDLERIEDVEYAPGLTLDLYHQPGNRTGRPAIVQIHGGSWSGGNRRQQARPLLHTLARAGWVGLSVGYSLSPVATFPDHLVDLKRAIAWIRSEGAAYGIDPDSVAVTGGSAGGHLAALVALTAGNKDLQPGFEAIDTRVQAAVPLYGIYDFFNRNGTRDEWPFIHDNVMKGSPEMDPDRYRLASPIDMVNPDAPPFFVIHGAHDTLVPAREAAPFVAALRGVSRNPVAYAEVPGGNHSFDVLGSVRTQFVVAAIERFLDATVLQGRSQSTRS